MIKQQLSQKFQQKFSPQQIQQAKLLALTSLEIENRIACELEENPLLEEAPDQITSITEVVLNDKESPVNNSYARNRIQDNPSPFFNQWAMNYSEAESFHEYLLTQWRLKNLLKEELHIGEYLIGNMDNDGYIRSDIQTLSNDVSINCGHTIEVSIIGKILQLIQELDPPGIGAGNLQECLLLQLKRKKTTHIRRKAIYILEKHFDLFAKKHYTSIGKICALSIRDLKAIVEEITHLNPKPGNMWETPEDKWAYVIPDFIVETKNGELVFRINGENNLSCLKINQEYTKILESRCSTNRDAICFIKQKIEDAQWFVTAIKHRHLILYRTMSTIVELQKHFFLTGKEQYITPMRLKDISRKCKYDVSTISRATFNKYVQTEWGIFPLRFFFSDSMQNEKGEPVSTRKVKAILKSLIETEDTKHPSTDDMLTDLLKKMGYEIARRTIAKYREQLNIPVARLRKRIK